MRIPNRSLPLALTLLALAQLPGVANATLELPGGDTLLTGALDDLRYGSTGASYVTPLLYLGDLGETDAPSEQAAVTDLAYQYATVDLGTSALFLVYQIQNQGTEAFSDLRFMLNVQADGSNSFLDFVTVAFGAAAPGEPDAFQAGDFSIDSLGTLLAANDGADGSNACGAPACDADLALQWNLATLDPGGIWQIEVALSDDGSTHSSRYLQATSADTANTALTLSGMARIVPEPTTLLLLGSGLAALRCTAQRAPRDRVAPPGRTS